MPLFIEPSPSGTNCTKNGHRMSGESNPPYKMDCQWNVTSSTDKGAVILKFTTFDFSRSDPSCIEDYVEVRNGPTEDAPLIGKFCGSKAPSPVQSSGSSLWVRYVVSGKIQTKVGMTYHDGPDKEYKLENEKGYQGILLVEKTVLSQVKSHAIKSHRPCILSLWIPNCYNFERRNK